MASSREKSYTHKLSNEDRLKVRFVKSGGEIREFSIQYEALINHRWRKITRYDNAHDSLPHRHVFYPNKSDYRHVLNTTDSSQAFTEAIETIKQNFEHMKERYIIIMRE